MIVEVYFLDRTGRDYVRVHGGQRRLVRRVFESLDVAKYFAKNLNQQFYKEPYVRIVRNGEVSIIKY